MMYPPRPMMPVQEKLHFSWESIQDGYVSNVGHGGTIQQWNPTNWLANPAGTTPIWVKNGASPSATWVAPAKPGFFSPYTEKRPLVLMAGSAAHFLTQQSLPDVIPQPLHIFSYMKQTAAPPVGNPLRLCEDWPNVSQSERSRIRLFQHSSNGYGTILNFWFGIRSWEGLITDRPVLREFVIIENAGKIFIDGVQRGLTSSSSPANPKPTKNPGPNGLWTDLIFSFNSDICIHSHFAVFSEELVDDEQQMVRDYMTNSMGMPRMITDTTTLPGDDN